MPIHRLKLLSQERSKIFLIKSALGQIVLLSKLL
jgi:hypothetical protein